MRLHLFEFNDQPWLPSRIRNALTAYLWVAYRSTPFGGMFAKRVATLMAQTGSNKIIDLCSGSGGPIAIVEARLRNVDVTLTDLFPNPGVSNRYWPDPVDARAVPPSLKGTRTMFASFHHFRPDDAARILKDAFDKRCAIGVFEVTARTPVGILGAILIPFGVLLMTPKIRPLTGMQIVLTYLIPILPLLIFWDGLVSQLRTYTPEEMRKMTQSLMASDYEWECDELPVPGTPLKVPYLTGRPI
jgi:hypothetical protein